MNGKAGMPKGSQGIGVIAQDARDVVHYSVSTFRAKLNPQDREEAELYAFNSSALTFVTINAVKALSARIDRLEQVVEGKDALLDSIPAAVSLSAATRSESARHSYAGAHITTPSPIQPMPIIWL